MKISIQWKKVNWWLLGMGKGQEMGEMEYKGRKGTFRGDGKSIILMVGLYAYVKTCQIIHFKYVRFNTVSHASLDLLCCL